MTRPGWCGPALSGNLTLVVYERQAFSGNDPWDRDPPQVIYEGPLAARYNDPGATIAVDDPAAFLGPESARYRLDDL